MKGRLQEVSDLFRADAATGANYAEEVYPGYQGLVIADGVARSMSWGFPRRLKTMKPTSKPLKVNNARDDKLLTSFWKDSFVNRRCLIPVSQWAEAEGPAGNMTKTWYSLHGSDLFGVAGIWRRSDEWGDVYSMVMVDGCEQMADVHDRMPVILRPEHFDLWTQGSPDEALALVQTCDDSLVVDRSTELWKKTPAGKAPPTLL